MSPIVGLLSTCSCECSVYACVRSLEIPFSLDVLVLRGHSSFS